jgi:hypothetical protein
MMNLKRCGRKRPWSNLRYWSIPSIRYYLSRYWSGRTEEKKENTSISIVGRREET